MRYNVGAFDMVPASIRDVAKKMSGELAKRGIPHAVIGGMAVSAFSPPRTTNDVDFLISESDAGVAEEFGETTPVSGNHLQGVSVEVDGHPIDLMFLPDDLPGEVLSSGPKVDGIPVLSAQALVLLKMKAARTKDVGDVVEILKARPGEQDRAAIRKFVKKYAPDVLDDYDSTVMLADFEASGSAKRRSASAVLELMARRHRAAAARADLKPAPVTPKTYRGRKAPDS